LIPHGIAGWINTGSDRLIINSISGVAETGIYATGYQVALMISLLASAFNKAFVPYIYRTLDDGKQEGRKILVRYTYYYFVVIIAITFFVSIFSGTILSLVASEEYYGSNSYIYLIAIGFAADGLYYGVINYIFYSRKTSVISLVTFSSCILHLIFSLVLIPQFGPVGAAYSTTISYLFTFILSWFLSNRIFPMPWFSFK
jgi:O-antigen/teichoic acid export membrane protein